MGPYRFQDILAELNGLSLVQGFRIENDEIVFALHPLIKDWLRTRIPQKEQDLLSIEAADTVVRYYLQRRESWMSEPHDQNYESDVSRVQSQIGGVTAGVHEIRERLMGFYDAQSGPATALKASRYSQDLTIKVSSVKLELDARLTRYYLGCYNKETEYFTRKD